MLNNKQNITDAINRIAYDDDIKVFDNYVKVRSSLDKEIGILNKNLRGNEKELVKLRNSLSDSESQMYLKDISKEITRLEGDIRQAKAVIAKKTNTVVCEEHRENIARVIIDRLNKLSLIDRSIENYTIDEEDICGMNKLSVRCKDLIRYYTESISDVLRMTYEEFAKFKIVSKVNDESEKECLDASIQRRAFMKVEGVDYALTMRQKKLTKIDIPNNDEVYILRASVPRTPPNGEPYIIDRPRYSDSGNVRHKTAAFDRNEFGRSIK